MDKETKETFTYATLPSVRAKAMKKAEKEGLTLSEKIDWYLRRYIKPKNKKKSNWSADIDDTTFDAMNG